MKKIISLVLCFALIASLGLTAIAANDNTMKERLTAVMLKVKETLGIGDSFTTFNGNLNENGTTSLWSLSWSSDKEQIYVTANENGTVVSYNDNLNSISVPTYGRIPKFPKMSIDEAKAIAGTFLAKVLDTNIASVDLSGTSALDYSGSAVYSLNGLLKLNGIETPINISVSVNSATKQVSSFYRGDYGQDYSGVTKPAAATDKAAAAAALKGTLNMKMVYRLSEDGTHTAKLLYVPNSGGSFVVDAATGKLVDLSKLDWNDEYGSAKVTSGQADTGAYGPYAAPVNATVTKVEQATIDQMQGVLPQSELEKNVRSFPELGLTADYKLMSANYYTYVVDNKETRISASLQFAYTAADNTSKYLNVTMDAKSGKIYSVGGNIIYKDTGTTTPTYKYSDAQTESVAKTFAGKVRPDEFKLVALSKDNQAPAYPSNLRTYLFYRVKDNITFPENYISVGVDADTGYVVNFYCGWYDFDVTFPSASGAITADAATAKYAEGTGTALKYVSVPKSVQPSGLLLAYTTNDSNVWGVNALTGELLKATAPADIGLTYDDLAGNPSAAIINKLASFGVGFSGGKFKPNEQLTQVDALTFIESAAGRKITPIPLTAAAGETVSAAAGTADSKIAPPPITSETDDVYSMAYSMGILTPEEKNPTKLVTRAEFVKYLVGALGYNEIAGLNGIFKPGFKDDNSIPAALLGYVAIGKGLGIVSGDQNGKFNPNNTATRVQAAIMIYNCMNRK